MHLHLKYLGPPVAQVAYSEALEAVVGEDTPVSSEVETDESAAVIEGDQFSLDNVVYLIDKMGEIIIKNEVPFCELDSHAGDGDFGMSVAKGFRQLKREWNHIINEDKKASDRSWTHAPWSSWNIVAAHPAQSGVRLSVRRAKL